MHCFKESYEKLNTTNENDKHLNQLSFYDYMSALVSICEAFYH